MVVLWSLCTEFTVHSLQLELEVLGRLLEISGGLCPHLTVWLTLGTAQDDFPHKQIFSMPQSIGKGLEAVSTQ